MKRSRISESKIVAAVKEHEAGKSTAVICLELRVHQANVTLERRSIRYGQPEPRAKSVSGYPRA